MKNELTNNKIIFSVPFQSVLNLDGLKEISGGDKTFITEMLRVFVEDTPQELGSLGTAIQKSDFCSIQTTVHKLISSIGLMGLKDLLLHVLYEMEDLSIAGQQLPRISTLYTVLRGVCEQALAEARKLLG